MWGVRLCHLRNVIASNPFFFKAPTSTTKTFSTLSCLNQHLLKKRTSQSFGFFNKPMIKIDLPNRNVIAAEARSLEKKNSILVARKQVGFWLLVCSGMVYAAVTIGGYTRLTESGLSMVSWRFTFETFPLNEQDWIEEFRKYQEFPEYKQLKRDLTLEEFKKIWQTEYFHRNWGRFIGISFLIPAISFWFKGYFLPPMKKRILIFGSLIAAQGLMGWYMVKSGLEDRFHKETDIPRVSQYRLASHMALALVLYSGLFWTALDLLLPAQTLPKVTAGVKKIKILAHSCKAMVFLTALSGALVAGLDAGLVYNSFPKMGDKWIPDDILALSPKWKNFLENPTTVQFDHRIMGISTFSLITTTALLSRRYTLPPRARMVAIALACGAFAQATLGISTLVHYVPISQALLHQSGSVMLLTLALWFSHELKKLKYVPK